MSKTCYHTYNHVSIVSGEFAAQPCCRYQYTNNDPQDIFEAIGDSAGIESLVTTDMWKHARDRLDANKEIPECHICFDQERNGVKSRRIWYTSAYEPYIKKDRLQGLELALDFTCNMMCRHCKPAQSSKWAQAKSVVSQLQSMYDNPDNHYKNSYSADGYTSKIRDLILRTDFSDIRTVHLVGGEPFYSKQINVLIDKLMSESNVSDMAFSVSTNGSTMPDESILDFLSSTRRSIIEISIDAVGHLAECIRSGVDWLTIDKNIRAWRELSYKHPNIELSLHPTISLLNINKIQDIVDYCDGLDIDLTFHELNYPEYLNHKQLEVITREQWRVTSNQQDCSKIDRLNRLITSEQVNYNELARTYQALSLLDEYQGIRFQDVNSEVWILIKLLKSESC